MAYDIIPFYEGLPAVIDDVNTSLVAMNSTMLSGMMNASFGGIHNTYQDIIDDQDKTNKDFDEGVEAIEKIYKSVKKVAKAFAESKILAKGFSSAISYSENLMSMQDNISAMNDGGQSDTELRDKIYGASMRSRTDIGSTIGTVAGLSSGGFSNDEAVQYTENLNKMFATAGVSDEAQAGATSTLVAALSDGAVSGEELNSVLSITPEIVAEMAENMGVTTEQMVSMAEQGQLSADIMKNSMLGATESINAEFSNTRANWSDTMTNIGNMATVAFEPLGNKINEILNSPSFGTFMTNLGEGMGFFANILAGVLDAVSAVGGFMADHWGVVQPILTVIIGLLGYILIATVGVTKVHKMAETATKAWGAATEALSGIVKALNAVWISCPIVLIILAVIAAFYVVIGLINKFAGTSLSATGIIVGAFSVVWAFIKNLVLTIADLFMGLWERIKVIASNIQNAFMFAVNKIKSFFYNMAYVVFSLITKIAEGLNKLPFVSIDVEGLQSKADDYKAKSEAANEAAELNKNSIVTDFKYEKKYDTFQEGWVSEAWDSGYSVGENFADSMSMSDISSGIGDFGMSTGDVDYSNMFEGTGLTENTVNGINRSAEETVTNTENIATYSQSMGTNVENIVTNSQNMGTNAENIVTSSQNMGTNVENIVTSSQNMGTNIENINNSTISLEDSESELVSIGRSILGIMQENMEKERSNNNSSVVIDMRYMSNNVKSQADADNLIERLKSEISAGLNGKTDGAGGSVFAMSIS